MVRGCLIFVTICWMMNAMINLLPVLKKVFLAIGKDDKRLWSPDPKGHFLVKSFCDELHGEEGNVTG